MACSSVQSDNCYHVRSISLPSRSHPSTLTIEEELNKLKSWEIFLASTTTPLKAETICVGLSGLAELYNCVEVLLQLPLTQQALVHHQQEKWVDELLDGSVRLLDICGSTRDMLIQMKEQVQNLESALRRRGGESSVESNVGAYICTRKKMKKDIAKCLSALKKTGDRFGSSPLLHLDHHLSMVVRVSREVNVITISIFQSLLSFMSAATSKPRRWSQISKLMHKGLVACEETPEDHKNEVESVDVALRSLNGHITSKVGQEERVQIAQKRLKALEVGTEGIEDGLECMFRCLVQTRVSLLNIITY